MRSYPIFPFRRRLSDQTIFFFFLIMLHVDE
jgi:hypothetical protein